MLSMSTIIMQGSQLQRTAQKPGLEWKRNMQCKAARLARGACTGNSHSTLLPVAPSSSRVTTQVMKVSSLRKGSAQVIKIAAVTIPKSPEDKPHIYW